MNQKELLNFLNWNYCKKNLVISLRVRIFFLSCNKLREIKYIQHDLN
jgi:hypothetical protein